jgi:hypothetical protein
MIKKISYRLRFPFGAEFNHSPKYIFIKKIYKTIKKNTCLDNGNCKLCSRHKSCIYYLISGEDFYHYPSIVVENKYLEKTIYHKNEILDLTFYIIGNLSIFSSFIDEYFESTDFIFGIYYQKTRLKMEVMDEKQVYDGLIRMVTPFLKESNIPEMVNFYNQAYLCQFDTNIKIMGENTFSTNDYRFYFINNHKIFQKGLLGEFRVKNFPMVLTEIGIGKSNVIGGGRSICVSE